MKIILKNMFSFLNNQISNKLIDAKFITLITDIWTNVQMTDFLALGAAIVNAFFDKELLIIGMVRMLEAHNAENIKKAIESILNNLDFNKAKISAIVTDEGSSLLRLFKQIEDRFYIDVASFDEPEEQESGEEEKEEKDDDETEDDDDETEDDYDNQGGKSDEENGDDSENMDSGQELDMYNKFKNTIRTNSDNELEYKKDSSQNPTNYFECYEISLSNFEHDLDYIKTSRNIVISVNTDLQDENEEYDFKANSELITS